MIMKALQVRGLLGIVRQMTLNVGRWELITEIEARVNTALTFRADAPVHSVKEIFLHTPRKKWDKQLRLIDLRQWWKVRAFRPESFPCDKVGRFLPIDMLGQKLIVFHAANIKHPLGRMVSFVM
jgi:hypothetical protein